MDKTNIKKINRGEIKELTYQNLNTSDEWKGNMIKEITNIKFTQLELDNFDHNDILEYLCTT